MGRQGVLVALVALTAGGCDEKKAPHSCSGAAVVVTPTPPRAVVSDGGADADPPADDGGTDARTICAGGCPAYIEALRVGIEAAVPASCVARSFSRYAVSCVPLSTSSGCPTNTREEAQALEGPIRDYVSAEWPEIDIDASLEVEVCVCRVYYE